MQHTCQSTQNKISTSFATRKWYRSHLEIYTAEFRYSVATPQFPHSPVEGYVEGCQEWECACHFLKRSASSDLKRLEFVVSKFQNPSDRAFRVSRECTSKPMFNGRKLLRRFCHVRFSRDLPSSVSAPLPLSQTPPFLRIPTSSIVTLQWNYFTLTLGHTRLKAKKLKMSYPPSDSSPPSFTAPHPPYPSSYHNFSPFNHILVDLSNHSSPTPTPRQPLKNFPASLTRMLNHPWDII